MIIGQTPEASHFCIICVVVVSLYMVSGGVDGLSGSWINFSELQNGASVDLYGGFGSPGCFVVDDILLTNM